MKYLLGFLVLVALIAGAWYLQGGSSTPAEESVESTEFTWENATADDIKIARPIPGAAVGHSFLVAGSARGNWFFEASFPIEVLDERGNRLVISPAQADGDWMTTEFVPFSLMVTIPATYTGPATMVLRRDNASGLPEHDKSVSFPITVQ